MLLFSIQRLKLLTSFEFCLVQGVIILYIIIDLTKRAEINDYKTIEALNIMKENGINLEWKNT